MFEPESYRVEHLMPDEGSHGPVISSAARLRQKVFPEISQVVSGYIAVGATVFAGRPKLGKSWFMLDVGLGVSMAALCLGSIQCQGGDVLYLALEDNERRLQRRIDKLLGAFDEWPERFHYATEWPRANEGGLEAIEHWICSVKNPRLIVVDVLAMFRPARGSGDNSYESDYFAIKGLQSLASKYEVAIVIVHHTRKSGSDVDPFEKVSGTLGLSGAADTTIVLDRDGNGATLYGRGRDIEEIESAVEFDRETCRWRVQGTASEIRRSDERSEILALLADADDLMSPTDLAALTGKRNGTIRKLLHTMAKASQVRKTKRGRYLHPNRTDLVTDDDPMTPSNISNIGNIADDYQRARDGEDNE